MSAVPRGPDVVVSGAARSGTSYLAALLSQNERIDPGAVKEPNYFSRRLEQGPAWYDGLYRAGDDSIRLDASVSYTYPQHASALQLLAAAAPHALCVYLVREPIGRAISHFHYNHYYFRNDHAGSFAEAISRDDWYLQVSDYQRWLEQIDRWFSPAHVLVAPFEIVHTRGGELYAEICRRLSIDSHATDAQAAGAFRNDVVEHRSEAARRLVRGLRHSAGYPHLRRIVGPDRIRRIRDRLVRRPPMPTAATALAACSPSQQEALEAFRSRVDHVVQERLRAQDSAYGLDWAGAWGTRGP